MTEVVVDRVFETSAFVDETEVEFAASVSGIDKRIDIELQSEDQTFALSFELPDGLSDWRSDPALGRYDSGENAERLLSVSHSDAGIDCAGWLDLKEANGRPNGGGWDISNLTAGFRIECPTIVFSHGRIAYGGPTLELEEKHDLTTEVGIANFVYQVQINGRLLTLIVETTDPLTHVQTYFIHFVLPKDAADWNSPEALRNYKPVDDAEARTLPLSKIEAVVGLEQETCTITQGSVALNRLHVLQQIDSQYVKAVDIEFSWECEEGLYVTAGHVAHSY